MFTIKNLRKESNNGWTYLKCDFCVTEIESPFEEKTMWVAVENKNSDMLADSVYDAFVLVPLYLGMHYKQDVHIKGNISPRLYHNIKHYLMKIFDNFSDATRPINFIVDGFASVEKGPVDLIGTGISCGVDSLTTIYDNFIETEDENFRINSLFLANCGTHGDYEKEETRKIWLERAKLNKDCADELGLPMYLIDSNFHAFTHKVGEQKMGYLAIYSCVLSLQRYIKRYVTSSGSSYDDGAKFSNIERDFDMAGYAETYMPHLISTERFELVIDGCQYTRAEKIEKICEWTIAHKYLNVCVEPIEYGKNCSCCSKCMRTLMALDAMGKLEKFKNVFDIKTYYKKNKFFKYKFLASMNKDRQSHSLVEYLKQNNFKMPSKMFIQAKYHIYNFKYRAIRKIKKYLQKE